MNPIFKYVVQREVLGVIEVNGNWEQQKQIVHLKASRALSVNEKKFFSKKWKLKEGQICPQKTRLKKMFNCYLIID